MEKQNSRTLKTTDEKSKNQPYTVKQIVIFMTVVVIGLVGAFFALTEESTEKMEDTTQETTPIIVEKADDTKNTSYTVALETTETLDKNNEETKTEEEKTQEEERAEIVYEEYIGNFELPLEGTTGWASTELNFRSEPDGSIIEKVVPGTSFTILEENNKWFKVRLADGTEGYIHSDNVLVNLPDIIPSIIYEDTNSVASIFMSSGVELDGITGEQLYNVFNWNERLGCQQYDMPVLYGMTFKIMEAQKNARSQGYSLKIYETYRPSETQLAVAGVMKTLQKTNPIVADGLKSDVWSLGWFIATKVSNHQRGYAMDVSLVEIISETECHMGNYKYTVIKEGDYRELQMPTSMHELSAQAARYESPYTSKFASGMNDNAILLHKFCTEAGLSPLKSEWWHFNDETLSSLSDGKYFLEPNQSVMPNP